MGPCWYNLRGCQELTIQYFCSGKPRTIVFIFSAKLFVLFSLKFCNGKLTLVLSRNARKEERLKQLRIQQALQDSEEVTLTPRINPASRHMALRLVHRAAQQDPQLLTVIQSQPEGWVLGDRPAPAHRPSTQGMHIIAEM